MTYATVGLVVGLVAYVVPPWTCVTLSKKSKDLLELPMLHAIAPKTFDVCCSTAKNGLRWNFVCNYFERFDF